MHEASSSASWLLGGVNLVILIVLSSALIEKNSLKLTVTLPTSQEVLLLQVLSVRFGRCCNFKLGNKEENGPRSLGDVEGERF